MEIPSLPRNTSKRNQNTSSDNLETKSELENIGEDSGTSLSNVLDEVDRLLGTTGDQFVQPQALNSAYQLSKKVDSMISMYESLDTPIKFGKNEDEDSSFFQAVDRISKLVAKLGDFTPNPTLTSCFNRTSGVLQRSMMLLDDEFRLLLGDSSKTTTSKLNADQNKSLKHRYSFNYNQEPDNVPAPEPELSTEEEQFPSFSSEAVSTMNRIATAMISAGYEKECCIDYSILRKNSFKEALNKLGFDSISIDEVQRMQWESLESEIVTWIDILKQCTTFLLCGERKLCDSVFSGYPSISQNLYNGLAQTVITRFLVFVEAVVLMKRSAEKVFKYLDIYEAMRDLLQTIEESISEEYKNELISEASAAKSQIGEAAVCMFCDLENSIRNDQGRTPVPSGAVHPLTRYTMNYIKYACEYKDTLEKIFQKHLKVERPEERPRPERDENDDATPKTSPFAIQMMTVMDLLDVNLEMKSKLYRDLSLRYIFLMNNGRYIQRETWSKLLKCLSHEGLQVNGKVVKPVLKERFKSFNSMFDEIHKTQSTWVVSDEQLQSELRVSLSAVVIPEDIETCIEELFDGNPNSMGRKR